MKNLGLANWITLVRMTFIPVFLVFLLGQFGGNPVWVAARPWLAAIVFIILAVTDVVDGYVARTRNEVTTFGKFIDPLADKLLVTAALVGLVQLGNLPGWIAIVIISRELVVSGLRMVAVAEGKVIAASAWGKVKTVFQIIAIVGFIVKDSPSLSAYATARGAEAFGVLSWVVMSLAIALTIVSAVQYFYHARHIITGPWSGGDEA
ncbi:MAG: CDP-diacylglycerol--glycerol-3-phosphate 3-phosphatidyltransferase [Coriobacteriia bacterium]|nr:CDP-diacylglycerol--glycerol-3-phosphate 3-phosphatidyltransferase [Coriobacteriia bacterium]